MSDGMLAVQARVAQIQAMLGVRPAGMPSSASPASTTASTSSADFAMALQSALTDGTLGTGDGTSSTSSTSSTLDKLTELMKQLQTTKGTNGSTGANGTSASAGTGEAAAPTTAPSAPSAPSVPVVDVGAKAVSIASSYTGVKYQWGGEDPATGVDCSGLTQLVYGQLGISLPRVAADQARVGTAVESLSQARPGDLVFFGSPIHHVGIYAGDGKMVDAPRTGKTVGLHNVWGPPTAIRRLAPQPATGTIGNPPVSAATATSAVQADAVALDGPYAAQFTSAGERYGVDPALLSAVAKAESAYNPRAVSSAGAQGLMQLMPATARSLGVDPLDPQQAIDGAARLLSRLLRDFNGRTDLALAGYNAGPGAVRRYGGIPPYAETQTYVKRVTQYWEALR